MAEDDADDRLLAEEALKESKLLNKFYTVGDGEQLLKLLGQEGEYRDLPRPGLILLDLNMPRMDGREALKRIKEHPKWRSIPVVVLTTSKREEDVLRSYHLGANSYITKPVTFEALVEVMKGLKKYWIEIVELPSLD